jgi:hypothetical protein
LAGKLWLGGCHFDSFKVQGSTYRARWLILLNYSLRSLPSLPAKAGIE